MERTRQHAAHSISGLIQAACPSASTVILYQTKLREHESTFEEYIPDQLCSITRFTNTGGAYEEGV